MGIWKMRHTGNHATAHGQYTHTSVSVDFQVSPIQRGHQCGIVYTVDAWATVLTAPATFVAHGRNNYEVWNVTVSRNFGLGDYPTVYFWYALFVTRADGSQEWDNNGGWNHECLVPSPAFLGGAARERGGAALAP